MEIWLWVQAANTVNLKSSNGTRKSKKGFLEVIPAWMCVTFQHKFSLRLFATEIRVWERLTHESWIMDRRRDLKQELRWDIETELEVFRRLLHLGNYYFGKTTSTGRCNIYILRVHPSLFSPHDAREDLNKGIVACPLATPQQMDGPQVWEVRISRPTRNLNKSDLQFCALALLAKCARLSC